MHFQNYIYGMLFGEKKKQLTKTEETLMVSQKISTSIDRLHTSMENLATSIDSQTNKVEVIIILFGSHQIEKHIFLFDTNAT